MDIKERSSLHSPKEIKPGVIISTGLIARTRTRQPAGNGREPLLKRKVAAAVEDALVTFHGTRGGTKSDEKLWANFAWRRGYQTLLDAIDQGRAEMAQHEDEIPDAEKPSILQTILNRYWRKEVR